MTSESAPHHRAVGARLLPRSCPSPPKRPARREMLTRNKKPWDINQPLGPAKKIEFETTEGTWLDVDVSPDGKRIVFDLLGDLYAMPIEGTGTGLAERLTSGAAFDMQPRFSPDGKWIAFASDRDGLLNLWVMKPDGSGARQVSKEKQWYVNSPAWSPDSQYIYGAQALRERAFARRRRDLDVPRERRRWSAGHRQERLAEGCRRARRSHRMADTSTTARTSRRDRPSNTTRIRTASFTRSSAAI